MTKDEMDLQALVGKTADGDFLREMIGFAAQRLMELEVGGLTLQNRFILSMAMAPYASETSSQRPRKPCWRH